MKVKVWVPSCAAPRYASPAVLPRGCRSTIRCLRLPLKKRLPRRASQKAACTPARLPACQPALLARSQIVLLQSIPCTVATLCRLRRTSLSAAPPQAMEFFVPRGEKVGRAQPGCAKRPLPHAHGVACRSRAQSCMAPPAKFMHAAGSAVARWAASPLFHTLLCRTHVRPAAPPTPPHLTHTTPARRARPHPTPGPAPNPNPNPSPPGVGQGAGGAARARRRQVGRQHAGGGAGGRARLGP